MKVMTIYRIEPDVDNFRSLLPVDAKLTEHGLLALDGTTKISAWNTPIEAVVDNADAPEPDIYDFGAGNLLLHDISWQLLKPHLEPDCEFLPVTWYGRIGYVVNVVGHSACIDPKQTKWVIGRESGKRIRIEKYAFLDDQVPSNLLFKIGERPFELFCIARFRNLIESNGVTGLAFVPVWPSE